MASIRNLRPGQIVYEVTKVRARQTRWLFRSVRPVSVIEVDTNGGWVLAAIDRCEPQRFFAAAVARWRVRKPV